MDIRISPSKLENFRLMIDEEYFGTITKDKVIETIKGEVQWTPQSTFGSAFGAVMENGKGKYYDRETKTYIIQDGQMPHPFVLTEREIKHADEYHKKHPYMTFESWVWHTIEVDGHRVVFSMRTDGAEGLVVHENKTSTGSSNYEFYQKSLQWQLYALALKPQYVQYNVFNYKSKTKDRNYFQVSSPKEYIYYPYIGMEDNVKSWIRHFINFCENENLIDYIKKK